MAWGLPWFAVVPSSQHEHLVDMFRTRGELAPALLELCAALRLPHACAELAANDLTQSKPTEYRADAVIELRGPDRALVAAVIVEVQLRRDPRKRYSWPVYLSTLRSRRQCDVVLFVLTPDPATARWARQPIATGHPGFVLQPIAISLDELPRSISRERAREVPELAVLSALAHRDPDAAETAIRAIKDLDHDQLKLYMELICTTLSDADRRIVEARVKSYITNPDIIEYFLEPEQAKAPTTRAVLAGLRQGRKDGRKLGRKEGREQGRKQGHEEGRVVGRKEGREAGLKQGRKAGHKVGRGDGLQDALTVLIRDKLKAVPRVYQNALSKLDDPRVLTRLIRAVSRAPDAHHVRQALSEALRRPASRRKVA